ncbi:MAG: hypothetical protein EBR91_09585 [Flavobacteriia bacterium]|nr:hypothetical protein [Flavobacteriia bacterium]
MLPLEAVILPEVAVIPPAVAVTPPVVAVIPVPAVKDPENVDDPDTLNVPVLTVPVVVILLAPVLIDPKPGTIEPEFSAPTLVKLVIVVTEFCVAVLIVPSIFALIVPIAPVNTLPLSVASGIYSNLPSLSL